MRDLAGSQFKACHVALRVPVSDNLVGWMHQALRDSISLPRMQSGQMDQSRENEKSPYLGHFAEEYLVSANKSSNARNDNPPRAIGLVLASSEHMPACTQMAEMLAKPCNRVWLTCLSTRPCRHCISICILFGQIHQCRQSATMVPTHPSDIIDSS